MKHKIAAVAFTILSLLYSNQTFPQWVQMSNGMGNSNYVLTVAANGNNIFAGTVDSGIYLSTNNGVSWTQTVSNIQYVRSIAINENNVFAGAFFHVLLSTNNGVNWAQTSLNKSVNSLAISGNNIFAGADIDGVYLSTNNGVNWTKTALSNQIVLSLAVSGNNIFAGAEFSGIFFSSNNGVNWNQTAFNNQTALAIATQGNNVFVGTYDSGVYISTNNGISWAQTALNNFTVSSFAISGNNIFAGSSYYGVYLTTNNGSSWIQKNQGLNSIPAVTDLLISNNFIFAATYSFSVWRRELSEIIGIQNISTEIPRNYKLEQNYPNPFNPNTVISFQLPVDGRVSLKIYDMLGREAATLVNEKLSPGTYTVDWNASQFPSGVYFYKLTTDNFTETKRMMFLK